MKRTRQTGPKEPQAVDRHVATRIRDRRRELGIVQEALGEALGVTFQQIQKYEKGANRISAGRLFEIANLFDVEISYFFEGLARGLKRRKLVSRNA
jgi:transcriptional regulator with XRE-family HTH domain